MERMFYVRSARAQAHPLYSRTLSPCMLLAPPPPHTRASGPAPHPALYAPLSTRQVATAFNQPLSFDTSSVKPGHPAMQHMFYVRSARALAPSLQSGPTHACRLRRRRPTPPRLPTRISPPIACPPFRLGRTRTPCPTPTSCLSVARGRAPRPSPITRAGVLWEAAR